MIGLLAAIAAISFGPITINRIIDGDTANVLWADRQMIIRLYGLDAPEKKQPWGTEATLCAKSYLLGKEATIKSYGTDLYGRTLGEVIVGGQNINLSLVLHGCAWATPKYLSASTMMPYVRAQESARNKKIGLWAHPDPIEPSIWRKLPKPKPIVK